MSEALIVRRAGTASVGVPKFTYTGSHTALDDGDGNWRIKFLTSGDFTPQNSMTVDVFLVGGGGAGGVSGGVSSGGGGGYTKTHKKIDLQGGTKYTITIGAGATGVAYVQDKYRYATGGQTSAFGLTADGGQGGAGGGPEGYTNVGGKGGSGGGGLEASGGSDGGNGKNGPQYGTGGAGQGTTTREFGESSGALYAGGGAGRANAENAAIEGGAGGGGKGVYYNRTTEADGAVNTGGGGGAVALYNSRGGHGGSGIVIIRNAR